MLTSMMAISWPVSTTASTTPGDAARPARRPLVTAGRRGPVFSVMPLSLPPCLCWYQEPGYPGTNTTWHGDFLREKMGNVTMATINGSVGPAGAGTGRGGVASARRTERAAFLRARRERILPEDVGLPPGTRRRTAGLRREELAQLAGVGVTWYTWLEQGRKINASVQVLDAVATTLRLDATERAHLFRLADPPGARGPRERVRCP